jgi:hypothetical protein
MSMVVEVIEQQRCGLKCRPYSLLRVGGRSHWTALHWGSSDSAGPACGWYPVTQ